MDFRVCGQHGFLVYLSVLSFRNLSCKNICSFI